MKLEIDEKYITKCGNTVACFREDEDGFWCRYEKVIQGHEDLLTVEHLNNQLWSEDGKWVKYPGGIHDIISVV